MAKRRKGIRKLAAHNQPKMAYRSKAICCVLIGISFWLMVKNPNILDDFICCYREQYHLVVYGTSDYCSRFFDYTKFLRNVRENIYGQDEALDLIENTFKIQKNLTSHAIVGTTGVGKTHFLNLVRAFYPWQDNIHHYVWSSFPEDKEEKYIYISNILNHLSTCGYNLILIDDFTPNEKSIVLKYQQLIENYLSNQTRSLKLIVIYVFNILQYTEGSRKTSGSSWKDLQHLGSIETINFKELSKIDVGKCVEKTASDLDIVLSREQKVNIVDSIDVSVVGCKTVHAKFTKNMKQ